MKQSFQIYEKEPMWSWRYHQISGGKPFLLSHHNPLKNWVAQKMKGILDWMGVKFNTQEDVQILRSHTIRADSLCSMIREFGYSVEMLFNEKLKYCVMGPDEFQRLVGESYMNSPVQFTSELHMRRGFEDESGRYIQAIVWGVSVAVFPWVKGLVMIPDLKAAPDDNINTECFGIGRQWY